MSTNNNNIPFKIIPLIAFFNIVFLICSLFFLVNTGDLVLKGIIDPGKPFESEFILNDNKDVTIVFHALNSVRTEQLKIIIMNSNGEVVFSKLTEFTTGGSSDDPSDKIYSSYNSGSIFTPKTSGRYYINITGAEFSTDIEIKSGMINIAKKSNFYNFSLMFSMLIMGCWVIVGILSKIGILPKKFASGKTSKKQDIIALLISLVTTYIVIYFSSM